MGTSIRVSPLLGLLSTATWVACFPLPLPDRSDAGSSPAGIYALTTQALSDNCVPAQDAVPSPADVAVIRADNQRITFSYFVPTFSGGDLALATQEVGAAPITAQDSHPACSSAGSTTILQAQNVTDVTFEVDFQRSFVGLGTCGTDGGVNPGAWPASDCAVHNLLRFSLKQSCGTGCSVTVSQGGVPSCQCP